MRLKKKLRRDLASREAYSVAKFCNKLHNTGFMMSKFDDKMSNMSEKEMVEKDLRRICFGYG